MKKNLLFLFLCFAFNKFLPAQQVLMQGWYWDYPKTTDGKSWADTLRLKAASLKQAGITHIWFPPHAVSSSGASSNGYNPMDLFIGNQTTGLGTRPALNAMLTEFTNQGLAPVADVIFNHRDGGKAENNPAVKDYITNYYTAAKEPFPSDRFRCILLLGGSSGNGAGDYYFKISSKTQDPRFNNYGYKVYIETKTRGFQNLAALNESEPNGGGDCGEGNNTIQLGRDVLANVDGSGCKTDEFHISLTASDFNAAGDTLFIYLTNTGAYSDHRIYGIWSSSVGADIVSQVQYQTYTDFSSVQSGRGQMNYDFFKPNSSNASTQTLSGDWDGMYFFYDYDQFQKKTQDTLINYAKWNWTDLNVRGFRMDAVKQFTPQFVGRLLDSLHKYSMDPSLVVGEWYSTNTSDLSGWINNVKSNMDAATQAAIQPKIFDFSLRENLRQACDAGGFDVRNVFIGSLRDAANVSGYNIVTFVNNHDFRDASGFASLIRNNPNLAYTYILTNNQLGVPTIFYPDYYGYPAPNGGLYAYHPTNLPSYQPELNRLMLVLKTYINGSPSVDYLNRFSTPYTSNFISGSASQSLIYQLEGFSANGNKDVIVAINFSGSPLKVDHQINTRSGAITQGMRFTDVLAKSAYPYAVVNSSNQIYMELPAYSYSVWVQGNLTVLPLKLKSFTAAASGKNVKLAWSVSDNQEAQDFDVERTDDGVQFNTIAHVNAKNMAGDADYTTLDAQPKLNTAMLYRLKLKMRDGQYQYSDLRLVRIDDTETKISLKQNPVNDLLNFSVQNADGNFSAEIIGSDGKLNQQKQFVASAVQTDFRWPVKNLSPGSYFLIIKTKTLTKSIQFVKD